MKRAYLKPNSVTATLCFAPCLCTSPPDDDDDDDVVEITFGIEIGPGWNDAYHKEIWEE